jgi:hypothetical protein
MERKQAVAQYRKKPVVIEAWHFDGSWASARPIIARSDSMAWADRNGGQISIETLEGEMIASADDWIIKGVKGEFYPCKPHIFALTYEPEQDAPRATSDSTMREALERLVEVCRFATFDNGVTAQDGRNEADYWASDALYRARTALSQDAEEDSR